MEIDSPWLLEGESSLVVNGVNVVPLVEAELSRRFPGRELRAAEDPEGLRAAWSALERTWAATLERATAMPGGTIDASVGGEWSFAETLRHLVMATDTWLGKAILEREQPYHPAVLPNDDNDSDAYDPGAFSASAPSFAQVLEARGDRQTMVRGSWPPSLRKFLRSLEGIPTIRTTRRRCSRACAPSWRRNGSTTAMPCAT